MPAQFLADAAKSVNPSPIGTWMHEMGRAVWNAASYAVSATSVGVGVVAQATGDSGQNAGAVAAVCGVAGMLVTLYFRNEADKREHDRRLAELKLENDKLRRRVEHLDVKAVQTDANTTGLAATKVKADVAIDTLRKFGWLKAEESEHELPIPPRVLVVEDNPDAARALVKVLAREHFEVDYASTCPDALDRLAGPLPFDWIILDLLMQGCDGEEILKEVRARHLSTRVAVTTGVVDPQRIEKLKLLQPDHLLWKPIDLKELIRLLRAVRPGPGASPT